MCKLFYFPTKSTKMMARPLYCLRLLSTLPAARHRLDEPWMAHIAYRRVGTFQHPGRIVAKICVLVRAPAHACQPGGSVSPLITCPYLQRAHAQTSADPR